MAPCPLSANNGLMHRSKAASLDRGSDFGTCNFDFFWVGNRTQTILLFHRSNETGIQPAFLKIPTVS
jgi:hypothetical protein